VLQLIWLTTGGSSGVISAFEELQRAGHLGEKCLALVEKLLREELRRFRPLTHLEFEDVVQDFLVDRIKPLTASLLSQATDDDSLAKLLRISIRNWLIDRARETGTGHIRRTLEKVLGAAPEVERVAPGEAGEGRWRIAGGNAAPWAGSIADLTAAAWSVREVRVPQWSSPTRRAPLADRDSAGIHRSHDLALSLTSRFRSSGAARTTTGMSARVRGSTLRRPSRCPTRLFGRHRRGEF
jgi:hypothetical protein